ncbi:hypothetical protein M6I34_02300 [Burkholderiaceae bacterium FT117]|uniref:hypothetical protein n=1 Tax=Zeimonas sediminis TaxID=2944268 RepID=UPI002342E195|nr:hypothetical protein [Zeimonas sediminis]MCM5569332.1 hypothetical protein [Zeimonas sediminis]
MSGRRCALALLAMSLLAGCGGGGGEREVSDPGYVLGIDGAEIQSSTDPQYANWLDDASRWYLSGSGFLPPGTTCGVSQCRDQFGFMSSAYLGAYEMTWRNETTGASGRIDNLSWFCWCSNPPQWSMFVPVVPGNNLIVVTQRAGTKVQTDTVTVIVQ